jgi:aspartyl-tRNA(Asn)/glutamyl-tRNA(Gln) amidotransferase subunit B
MKNLSSFRVLQKAIEYEYKRQIKVIEAGEKVVQETRRFDESKGITYTLRSKENAHDYRYFPEPDLLPIVLSEDYIQNIKSNMPELPEEKRKRYIEKLALSEYDARVLTASCELSTFFEDVLKYYDEAKTAANWVLVELMALVNQAEIELDEIKVTPEALAGLLNLIKAGQLSGKMAKGVLEEMFSTGRDAQTIVKEKGLSQISDTAELEKIIDEVLSNNPASVADYQGGKDKALGFLVGQVMRQTKGAANPKSVNEILLHKLKK